MKGPCARSQGQRPAAQHDPRGRYLGSCVGHVQVMQGDVLDDLLLLMHVPLGQGDVLFSFKVKFCGVGVTPALPLQRQRET